MNLHRLHKLRVIFCSDNRFTSLPEALGACPHLEMVGFKANKIRHVSAAALPKKLRWLILTDNQISELPGELGACTRLQKLMLAGNRCRICQARWQPAPNWNCCVLPRIVLHKYPTGCCHYPVLHG